MKTVIHLHQNFYPYQGGSTMRLLNMIADDREYKHVVISKKLEGDERKDFHRGISIYRYKRSFEIPLILAFVCRKHRADLFHFHNYRPAFWGNMVNTFLRKPVILEMHSVYEVKGRIKNYFRKRVLCSAKNLIVISEESKRILQEEDVKGDIYVLYNGINVSKFKTNDEKPHVDDAALARFLEDNRDKILVGYVGSLREFQGISNVIKIINSVQNDKVRFLIIGGEDHEIQSVRAQVHQENVFLRSFVSQEAVVDVYAALDILLMPRPIDKQTESAVPLKPIEALAASCRVYSTPAAGMLELKQVTKSDDIEICSVEEMIEKLQDENLRKTNKDGVKSDLSPFDVAGQQKILHCIYNRAT